MFTKGKRIFFWPMQNGRMLLHWAALGGHHDLVQFLLSLGAPVDPGDDVSNFIPFNHTLHLVQYDLRIRRCLGSHSKRAEFDGLKECAASAGREKVVVILITEGANVNAQTIDGHSALQYAASKNWHSICLKLIEKGADVNIIDNRGATPLHRAASKGNIEIVKMLLAQGSRLKIDKTDAYGNSALHLACEEDRNAEAKLLVSHGANLELTNREKKIPLDLCTPTLARQLKALKEKPE
ncbi:26S proteasome non-ATPase regulatory subunit 10-like isoform X2 [Fopius arisanus]|uniref:26S proteasome non-ATPase regulatory subunit 10-like isoform X2 n=1 Tax=Fopius arisanus TaxID=64838 RepID=A0A9R1TIJ1_9HYME|nr:PREDICTED: 26S proteasome non-ATPase regulatory subunit 10-like isoform X2 [Fopius arisanus]